MELAKAVEWDTKKYPLKAFQQVLGYQPDLSREAKRRAANQIQIPEASLSTKEKKSKESCH